jgi:hypothetical protein
MMLRSKQGRFQETPFMNEPERKLSRRILIACAALFCPLSASPFIIASAAAQDYGHMRVQFGHGSAWTEASPRDFPATLPPGPAHGSYGYAHTGESGGPNDRVRLKASIFNGM